ncbi:MAG: hypothetical protein ABJN57_08745 [Hyphomicrobiales bacterium]
MLQTFIDKIKYSNSIDLLIHHRYLVSRRAPNLHKNFVGLGMVEPTIYLQNLKDENGKNIGLDDIGPSLGYSEISMWQETTKDNNQDERAPLLNNEEYKFSAYSNIEKPSYDDWGKNSELSNELNFKEKPDNLNKLWLPEILNLWNREGFLISEKLLNSSQSIDAAIGKAVLIDCFGDRHFGYKYVSFKQAIPMSKAEKIIANSKEEIPFLAVDFSKHKKNYESDFQIIINKKIAEKWKSEQVKSITTFDLNEVYLEPLVGAHIDLDQWQSQDFKYYHQSRIPKFK